MKQLPELLVSTKKAAPYVIVAAILIVGISCFSNPFWSALKKKFAAGQTVVYFHELTDFDWDTVCILVPYSTPVHPNDKDALRRLFQDNDPGEFANNLPNLGDDGKWAFAFIKDKKVVAIKKRGRGLYLFDRYDYNCMSKAKVLFSKEGDKVFISNRRIAN